MKAIGILGTLKKTGENSNTDELLDIVFGHLKERGVETNKVRLANLDIKHGAQTKMEDDWTKVLDGVFDSEIVIFATPIHWGQHSSLIQKVIERMNQIDDTYLAGKGSGLKHKVAGMIVTGHEDGAQHVIGGLANALIWYGFNLPPECATYWVGESGMYFKDDKENRRNNSYTAKTAEEMAKNLFNYAKLISENREKLK